MKVYLFLLQEGFSELIQLSKEVFERFGFDYLFSFKLTVLTDEELSCLDYHGKISRLDDCWNVFVMSDYSPRPAGWCPAGWGKSAFTQPVENGRLNLMPEIQEALASVIQNDAVMTPPLLWTPTSDIAFTLLKKWKHDAIEKVKDLMEMRTDRMQCPYPVIQELGEWNTYARVCLVNYNGVKAICKIYRPGREKYLENRLLVDERLSHAPEVLSVLKHGPNWIVIPYLEDFTSIKEYTNFFGVLPLTLVRRLFEVVNKINEAGLAHLDFHPDHILFNGENDLYVIDFDKIYVYNQVPRLCENIMLTGYDNILSFDGLPMIWTYDKAWLPVIGFSLQEFLYGGYLSQQCCRVRYYSKEIIKKSIRYIQKII